ncbi:MAG: amino acid adenylation domain-containing protein, partial [Rhodobacteraceae bacterium]|nr:amino acid adenylation domain-containing protein [Paracoccaceae bacterium]
MHDCATFLDLLIARFKDGTAKTAFTFLDQGRRDDVSYARLGADAQAMAGRIQRQAQPGDRVLIVLPPGRDYVTALLACALAGMVAVPAVSPSSAKGLPRLALIAEDAGATLLLTTAALAARIDAAETPLGGVPRLQVDIESQGAGDWAKPDVGPDDLLFLQYTSGSTGAPKGVMISHRNVMANLALSRDTFAMTAQDIIVSWLPPHHDFGLVGGIFSALFNGCHAVHLTPLAFLTRPQRWLQAISEFRATITGAPNFAWDLCAARIGEEERAGLDLSSLRVAINGAERVRPETVAAFCEAFAGCGFDPAAVTPAYGLAETTLLVSARQTHVPGQLPRTVESAAPGADGNGPALHRGPLIGHGPATGVVIVGPQGQELPQGEPGEIWVSGASVASGYWRNPAETRASFGHRLPGREGTFLKTGDIGLLDQGELFIAGRSKEMMILGGRNLFPQDIEPDVEALSPAFRRNGAAVFTVEEGRDTRLVVVQEVLDRRLLETEGLVERLRAMLAEQHEIADLAALLLVRTGDLPRTTSGKIQRFRCARILADHGFRPIWSWQAGAAAQSDFAPPHTATEIELAALWRELLGGGDISIRDNFLELAGNSLLATQIISALDQRFGVDISLTALFENPTIEKLAVEIDHVLTARATVLPQEILPRPASPLQERLFYLDQFAPGDPIYTVSRGYGLDGEVNVEALARACAELLRRHEVLRYRFVLSEGRPVAQLVPDCDGALECRIVADPAQAAAGERARAFDLLQGRLIRVALLTRQDDEERHHLVLCAHRIVADDVSMDRIAAELAELYSAYAAGLAPRLAPPRQHAAEAVAQLDWMASDRGRADLDWWRAGLAGVPALLALPTDHSRAPVQDHAGARHGFFLPLQATGPGEASALAATAFAVLLYRYCGQEDICIGLPSRPATAGVGPLTDMLPLRLAVAGDMRFADLRNRLAAARAAAETRSMVPFDAMVAAIQPERHLGHSPIFQVLLDIAAEAPAGPVFRGLVTLPGAPPEPRAMYDLTLRLRPAEGGFAAEFDYATALFDAATIEAMARHLIRVLEQRDAPGLLAHPLPDAVEQRRLVQDWQATAVDYPEAAPLARMFELQAARMPDTACVVAAGAETLSFAELNRRANRLAHALIAKGVGPDDLVGLCVERGAAMMVALVAILKAGAGYLPLDPALPRARLDYMIGDARPRAIVTVLHLAGTVAGAECPVIAADDPAAVADQPESNPPARGSMQTLAYCIYTSGSTGNPKGVMVAQAGVANRLCWMTRAYGVVPGERVLQKTPYSFDVSVWELFWPLIAGATLVMARPGGHQDVAYLAQVIREQRITTIHFVPPMLEFFIDYADLGGCGSLRQILCSGQALPVALQNRVLAALPGVALRNLYGPTEASIEVSHWDCVPRAGQMSVPIGHPIGNIRLYVLDAALNPVPVGVAGELFLAGIGLARGYLNRPDLTAAAFLPDPFGPPGERMYRSGDLARHLPDGAVEYLGRIDDQVKIRGFRIELGEIEARLNDLPAIREALVVASDPGTGERSLVAYLVAEPGAGADEAAVKAALLDLLPDYMVPSWFVWLQAFPVTANGKIDRRALPKPSMLRPDEGFVAPRGETQVAMAAIWAALLGRDRVGAQDRFFDLGGHSLLATQAISKIRARFGVDVPLRAVLFDRPSLAELAAEVDALRAGHQHSSMTAIRPAPREADLQLSFSQKRLWFLDQLEPGNPFYNIPAPTRLRGMLDVAALRQAINGIVARHESLRTTFLDHDGAPVQVIAPALELDIPLTDLSMEPDPEAEARRLAVEDAQTPFRLDRAPLLRARLLRLGEQDHVILFNMHHIISDGWSMGVLVTEFVALYRAAVEGRPDPLPPLAIQYLDFAAWQRDWLQGDNLQRQLDYWTERLADAPPVLPLPTDRPRPPAQSYRGATFDITLPADLTAELYALGARHQSTLYMVLLAAFNVLLARHARVRDLCVGTYIANRNRAEIEGLIGFFVNMLVLRSDVAPEASFATLLQQVRRTALDAYANQDLPFEYLVEELRPERHLSHSPLFQVVFVLQNTPMDDLDASGLRTEPLAVESHVSKFDLTLRLTERAGVLDGCFEYATDLFDESSIAAMAGQFDHLLRDIIRRPDAALRDLELVGTDDSARLAVAACGPAAAASVPVLQAFAARVAEAPDHPAVAGPGGLSYAALDRASAVLARRLRAAGVQRGTAVGLCLGRGAGLVTAILACMKAGAAWLPLDPAMPAARQRLILGDARPAVVLAAPRDHAALREAGAMAVIDPATVTEIEAEAEAAVMPLPGCTAEDPAYILYTSGTTGQPKGVVIPHHGLMNHAAHHIAMCGLGRHDRVLQFATPAFDTSVEEIVPALMAGATLVPRPDGFLDTGAAFDAFLAAEGVTVLDLPTRFWQHWTEDSAGIPASVRLVIVGGEQVTRRQFASWSRRPEAARIRWINTYGPTEATVIATACEGVPDPDPRREIPIGRAIAGVTLRLLDASMVPVPPGMAGEIWLGGAGLGLGYLNRPGLTADRFRPDPYCLPGARLYRTGDLGRMRADGDIEFLGRVDDQIKLRGYRIEPAEIESVLLEAGATQALVLLQEDAAAGPRLLAYATGADEADLRRAVDARLPGYMVPGHILVLPFFPLTLSG